MADQEAKVNTPTAAYNWMAERWALPDTLVGGTIAMREACEKYLPREPEEKDVPYKIRVGRTTLFNAYGDTLGNLAERPFAEPIKLREESDSRLQEFVEDVDGNGQSLTEFCRTVFKDAVNRGLSHILADYPPAPAGLTLAQEQAMGLRPFWVHVPAKRIIGWRTEHFRGEDVLVQLRISEEVVVPDGEWGEKIKQRVKVYTRTLPTVSLGPGGEEVEVLGSTTWVLYEKVEDAAQDEWQPIDRGVVTINVIPLVTLYTNRLDRMMGSPLLEDLAWKNLEHFQSGSDQRHVLRFARMPMLWVAGHQDGELEGRVSIGAHMMFKFSNPDAKIGYVEHEGNAIEAGRLDLEALKEEMVVLGLKPLLLRRSGTQTATAEQIENEEETSQLKSCVRGLENTLAEAFDLTLMWYSSNQGEVDPDAVGGTVDVCDRFTIIADNDEVDRLLTLRKQGDLSRETLFEELQKRGLLGEQFDAQKEMVRLASEDLAATEANDDDDDDDDDDDEGNEE